jgi:hypothetical protein
MNFGSLHYFLGIKSVEKQLKIAAQCWAEFGPGLQSAGVAACHARPAERLLGLGLAARSSCGVAHVLRARRALWRHGHRAWPTRGKARWRARRRPGGG